MMNSKRHWENIYETKEIDGVSWYQDTPTDSLNLIKRFFSLVCMIIYLNTAHEVNTNTEN